MSDSIRKFSSRKTPTKNELAEFRHYVSILKKQGKIPAGLRKGAKPIDARTARPRDLRGGKTLAEIVNANRDSLTPFTPARAKLLPLNQGVAISDLNLKGKSLATAFREMEEHPERFNALKNPKDRFAFEIEGTSSLQSFPDIEALIDEAFRYQGINSSFDVFHKRSKSRSLFGKLKIIRWTPPPGDNRIKAYEQRRKVRGKKVSMAKAKKRRKK